MSRSQPTVVFFPEGAFGPTNNCVGIAEVLAGRGARVVFVVEESFAGTLAARGFEERLMRLGPPPAVEEIPGQFWKDFIRDTAPVFRRSTFEQLEGFMAPTWRALIDGAMYVDDRLEEILDELRPDVVVEDNVVAFPAVVRCGAPWVRIVSCNPLEIRDPALPPPYSGLPTDAGSGWDEFSAEYRRTHSDLHVEFDAYVRGRGCPPLPELEFIHTSPHLNLYVYPGEIDYPRTRALDGAWSRLESCVRANEEPFALPDELADGPGALVYLSLGSLGSADVTLMQGLIDMLAQSEHRAIVSMGPQHELLRLGERMTGAEFLPQPSILPQVDVVMTHAGNNTVTESLRFGRPMIALPLFWDQYDNAQRLEETGFGVRLPTYEVEPRQLIGAIDRLAHDRDLRARLDRLSTRLAAAPGTHRAADLIGALLEA
jgi:MGT family glycosyltransferase